MARWSQATRTIRKSSCSGSVELDFGPEAWVLTAGPLQDYDGTRRPRPLIAELKALVGKRVNLLVRPGDQGDNALVFVLNSLPYRDPRVRRPG